MKFENEEAYGAAMMRLARKEGHAPKHPLTHSYAHFRNSPIRNRLRKFMSNRIEPVTTAYLSETLNEDQGVLRGFCKEFVFEGWVNMFTSNEDGKMYFQTKEPVGLLPAE